MGLGLRVEIVIWVKEIVIWVKYEKTDVEGKTGREVSIRSLPFTKLDDF